MVCDGKKFADVIDEKLNILIDPLIPKLRTKYA